MIRVLLPLLLFIALLGGCRKKQPPPPPPPVTLPPPIQPSQTPVVEAPAVPPQTPAVPQQAPPSGIVTAKPGKIAPPPTPPKKQPAKPSRAQRRNPPQDKPAATTAAAPPAAPVQWAAEKPETPPAKQPQFGELLDDAQRGQYQQQYESSLAAARASLAAVAGGKLNPTQTDTAGRIRGFILEAEKLHASDIRTAAQLAARAASLARDLESSLK
jgi:hypothetical protein